MSEPKKISDSEFQALVSAEIANSLPLDSSELSTQRSKAMDYYQGRPFGNEIDGRSQVVSTDTSDTIEWIMPTVMRMFTGGDQTVEYLPTSEAEVAPAKQATEYANYIWMRDNDGFLNLYSNFKDALLQKNGIGKVWWDDSKQPKRERYYGLNDDSYTALVGDDDIKVSEHTEREEQIELPPTLAPDTGRVIFPPPQKITVHDVVVTRMKDGGRVCVNPVAPEYFLISKDGTSIENARFVGDKIRTTLSELRSEGISEEMLAKIGGGPDGETTTQEEIVRDTVENGMQSPGGPMDESTDPLWKIEGYIKADVDGDGIAEMRKVTVAGSGYTIISNEAWDDARPYYSMTPIIMPHRFWGRSVAELVADIQLIKSTILRQYLDNAYINNNQSCEVVERNIIDPSEVLTSRPGQRIRVKESGSVVPIPVQQIGESMLAGLTYIDQLRENRTGVSERTQGLGANDLHETLGGEQMLMTAAMGKIELIARVFAETGIKQAFKLILGLICRYQQKPRVIQISDKWVPMDPRSWNEDMHVSVSVGMGTGDNQQKLVHAQMLGQAQQVAAQSGVLQVTPENAMATFELLVNAMGLKGPERFVTKIPPGTPPPPDPRMAKVQADMQLGQQKLQGETQLKQAGMQADAKVALVKSQADAQTSQAKAQTQAQVDHLHNVMEAQREQMKMQNDLMMQRFEAGIKTALELQLAHIKGAVAIEVARIGAKADSGAAAYAKESAGE